MARSARALHDIDFPIQQTFTTPAQVNAWLRQQGVQVVDDLMVLARRTPRSEAAVVDFEERQAGRLALCSRIEGRFRD